MTSRPRVDVLGVGVDLTTADDVLAFVDQRIQSRRPAQIVTVNAEFVMRARNDGQFSGVLARAEMATPDGAGVVWAMRRKGAQVPARVGGSDLIWSLSRHAAQCGYRVFLLGGAPGVAAAVAARLKQEFALLQVAGTHTGSPAAAEAKSIVDLIRRSRTDVLFVAFGAPQQELWIAQHLGHTGAAVAMGVGGSFDYIAGRVRRAPRLMREHGLEWLWRLLQQPWRWRRMLALPRFVWLIWTAGDSAPREERTRE